MDPIEWLERFVGFGELPQPDRKAIGDFGLLWSLFEGTMVDGFANARSIIQAVTRLHAEMGVHADAVAVDVTYFRNRYFEAGEFTADFEDLRFRNRDCRELVEAVLAGQRKEPEVELSAILIIVFRLRNNLFHGTKWGYRLRGQRANFEHANHVLMSVMEMNGVRERLPDEP